MGRSDSPDRRSCFLPFSLLRIRGAGDVHKRGGNVDDVADLLSHSPRFYHLGPMCDEWRARPAFVVGRLKLAIGRVAGVCPAHRNRAVALDRSWRDVGRRVGLLGTRTVVGEEQNQRVVPLIGRVERWRGGLGAAYLFPALSSAGASVAVPCSVSTLPLIKPDVRISRIRLSDKDSCVRPRNVAIAQAELDKTQLIMQVFVREA